MTKCCCGKYQIDGPIYRNGIIHEPLGMDDAFCGPIINHEVRDLRAELADTKLILSDLKHEYKTLMDKHALETEECLGEVLDRINTDLADAKDYAHTVRGLYDELLFAVGNKFPGESRHQTALRYIRQAERDEAHRQNATPHGLFGIGRTEAEAWADYERKALMNKPALKTEK